MHAEHGAALTRGAARARAHAAERRHGRRAAARARRVGGARRARARRARAPGRRRVGGRRALRRAHAALARLVRGGEGGGAVHAFEPGARARVHLHASVALNGLGDVVTVHDAALSDSATAPAGAGGHDARNTGSLSFVLRYDGAAAADGAAADDGARGVDGARRRRRRRRRRRGAVRDARRARGGGRARRRLPGLDLPDVEGMDLALLRGAARAIAPLPPAAVLRAHAAARARGPRSRRCSSRRRRARGVTRARGTRSGCCRRGPTRGACPRAWSPSCSRRRAAGRSASTCCARPRARPARRAARGRGACSRRARRHDRARYTDAPTAPSTRRASCGADRASSRTLPGAGAAWRERGASGQCVPLAQSPARHANDRLRAPAAPGRPFRGRGVRTRRHAAPGSETSPSCFDASMAAYFFSPRAGARRCGGTSEMPGAVRRLAYDDLLPGPRAHERAISRARSSRSGPRCISAADHSGTLAIWRALCSGCSGRLGSGSARLLAFGRFGHLA